MFRDFCLSLPGTTESLLFDENTLCFKVMDKIFAICDIDEFESINLNCEPSCHVTCQMTENLQCFSPKRLHNSTLNAIDNKETLRISCEVSFMTQQ